MGPCAQFFGYAALAIEYSRWYSAEAENFSHVLVYFAYIAHIVYTYQLLKLCSPSYDKPPEPAEVPGAAWWPGSWTLPAAFHHAVWLVAPPKELPTGQHDLVGEMRQLRQHLGDGYA